MSEYTHKALIAAGYVRTDCNKEYPGWVVYEKTSARVGFAGNNATMNNWIENISQWKKNFPTVYAWWIDPTQKDPFVLGDTTIIKGEDPMLVEEGQDGSESSESGVQDLHGDGGGPA